MVAARRGRWGGQPGPGVVIGCSSALQAGPPAALAGPAPTVAQSAADDVQPGGESGECLSRKIVALQAVD